MNVMIYNLENKLPEVVNRLQLIPDISIFFAFTKKDVEKLVQDVRPEIIFTGSISNGDTIFIQKISTQNPKLSIYILNETSKDKKLIFRELQSHKELSLGKIIKQQNNIYKIN
jgi:hypothetical protein